MVTHILVAVPSVDLLANDSMESSPLLLLVGSPLASKLVLSLLDNSNHPPQWLTKLGFLLEEALKKVSALGSDTHVILRCWTSTAHTGLWSVLTDDVYLASHGSYLKRDEALVKFLLLQEAAEQALLSRQVRLIC